MRAAALGLEVRSPASLREAAEQEAFAALGAEVAVVVAYGLILPRAVLGGDGAGVPQHPRLAACRAGAGRRRSSGRSWPGTRRPASRSWRWRRGSTPGRCCSREAVPIGPRDTAGTLHDAAGGAGGAADRGGAGRARPAGAGAAAGGGRDLRRQDRQGGGAGRLAAAGGGGRPADPRALALSRRLVRDRRRAGEAAPRASGPRVGALPGTVLDDRLAVACGEGAVRLLSLQRAGGGAVEAAAFLRGRAVAAGSAARLTGRRRVGDALRVEVERGQAMLATRREVSFGLLGLAAMVAGCGGGTGPAAVTAPRAPEPGMTPVANAGFDAWVAGFRPRALAAGGGARDLRRGLRPGGVPARRDRAGPQPDRVHPHARGLSGDRGLRRARRQGPGGARALRRRRSRRSRRATGSSRRW